MKNLLVILTFWPLCINAQSDEQIITDVVQRLESLEQTTYRCSAFSYSVGGVWWSDFDVSYNGRNNQHKMFIKTRTELPFVLPSAEQVNNICETYPIYVETCDLFSPGSELDLEQFEAAEGHFQGLKYFNQRHPFRDCEEIVYNGEEFIRHDLDSNRTYIEMFPSVMLPYSHLYVLNMLQGSYGELHEIHLEKREEEYVLRFDAEVGASYLNGDHDHSLKTMKHEIVIDQNTLLPKSLLIQESWGLSLQVWSGFEIVTKLPLDLWLVDRHKHHNKIRSLRRDRSVHRYYEVSENDVLWAGQPIAGCAPNNFRHIAGEYFGNDDQVLYQGQILPDADPATFVVKDSFAHDAQYVYVEDQKVPSANPESYQPINLAYAKDQQYVFFWSEIMPGADPSSFEVLYLAKHDTIEQNIEDYKYARDKNHVYWGKEVIEGVDASSFVLLNNTFARDKKQIIRGKFPKPELDINSFEALPRSWSKDKNGVYNFMGHLVENLHGESFEMLNVYYSKDKNGVYWNMLPIEGADPETFQLIENSEHCTSGKDKNANYYMGKPE